MATSRKTTKKGRQTPRKMHPDGINATPNSLMSLSRSITNVMPDRFFTRLWYKGNQALPIAAAGQYSSYRWRPSAAYDIDPTLGSTATVGFNEFAAFYNQYRVTSSAIKVTATAGTAVFPRQLVVVPLNGDPGISPTLGTVVEWCNNPYSKVNFVGSLGTPPKSVSQKMSTEKIFGSKMVYNDDNFMSLTNNIPNNNWYWAIGISGPVPASSTETWLAQTEISIDIEFFSRKFLTS